LPSNSELFLTIYSLGNQNYLLDRFFIFGANELIFITFFISLVLILLGGLKERKAFLFLLIGLLIAEILIKITHIFYFEPRPYVTLNLVPLIKHVPDAAFPSEHTTMAAAVAFASFFAKSKYALLFIILMLWVGFSRIFVGVHYPLDILGGILYGFISIFISSKILNKFLDI
jgi:undecaprenyl-diphosphatase